MKSGFVLLSLLLSFSSACGRQVVEFGRDGGGPVGSDARNDVPDRGDTQGSIDGAGDTGSSDRAGDVAAMDAPAMDVPAMDAPAGDLAVDSATDRLPDATSDLGIDSGADVRADAALDAPDAAINEAGVEAGVAPTVISTKPAPLAMNVSINQRPTATFSRAMDATTVNMLTFTVMQGLLPVAGSVSLDPLTNTATFTPTVPLGVDMTYTATVTTGAKDLAGRPLAMNHVWTFRTAACSQGPVALGAAAGFVVLAGATVTSTGPTSVTGDLGVSPGTAVTGFPPGIVIGAQHAGDPAAAQAIASLTTAYNDAKGRTLCPVTVAGNLGGQTLYPGLYKSTTSLEISSGDLTLDARGEGDAVFIFQMASTLTTTAGRQVILTNGAKSANVYWQVGTSATFGTTTAFKGTVMADQAITMNSGGALNGRLLARIAAVNLDSNTIVKPAP